MNGRRLSAEEIDVWAATYIAFQLDSTLPTDGHPFWWAAEQFMDDSNWENHWDAILAILARQPPERTLSGLAAGPLEDLIHHAGSQFIDRIELEAQRNPALRTLLDDVWESGTADIWSRVEAARGDPR